MTPDRWKQIEDMLQFALGRTPAERAAFLDEACAGDDSLRQDVESLLASNEQVASFLETPALQYAAGLLDSEHATSMVGLAIGPYTILSLLGAGGMGEVFLAEDARLGRKVAIKLLPVSFSSDKERVRRFQQEARAASALNHPNIITVHEIGLLDDRHFIVTEHIEGQTLRSVMAKRKLSLRDLVDLAIQVVSALEAAHQAGIVHRDIKPENIMLRPDGYVKVLDFGLVKLSGKPPFTSRADELAGSSVNTMPGVVMGTANYMSPEQARGQEVDKRTDIFSLGVVLYEMVTGKVPFDGDTTSDVIAAILQNEPAPLLNRCSDVPTDLRRIVSKALRKDKQDRYQTSQELLADLRSVKRELELKADHGGAFTPGLSDATTMVVTTRQEMGETFDEPTPRTAVAVRATSSAEYLMTAIGRHKRGAMLALATIVVAIAGIGYAIYRTVERGKSGTAFQTMRPTRVTTSGHVLNASVSPDGKYIVYLVDEGDLQSLRLRQTAVAASDVEIVPPAEARYVGVTFSRDDNYVYYAKSEGGSNGLFRVAVLGGASKKVLGSVSSAISFSPDGEQFAFIRGTVFNRDLTLMIANKDGTGEKELAAGYLTSPAWSPDGKVIVCGFTEGESKPPTSLLEVRVADHQTRLIDPGKLPSIEVVAWLPDSSGLIVAGQQEAFGPIQLWHLSFPKGEVQRITNDLNDYLSLSVTADSAAMVAVRSEQISYLWVAPNGNADRAKQISPGLGNQKNAGGVCWTPDGKLVYESNEGGSPGVWISDADGGGRKQLSDNTASAIRPSVSMDGRYVVFSSERSGYPNIWRMDSDGGNLKQLTSGTRDVLPHCSPDSRWVVYTSLASQGTLWKVSIDGGDPVQLTNKWVRGAVHSPDGKLMVCWYRDEREISRLKMAVLPAEGGDPINVFPFGRSARPPVPAPNYLRWTPDGSAVLYIDTRDGVSNIWSQPLDGGSPKRITDFKTDRIFSFDWSKDGKQLALSRGTQTSDVVLLTFK